MALKLSDITFPLESFSILRNSGLYVDSYRLSEAVAYYYDKDENRFLTQIRAYDTDILIQIEDVETVVAFITSPSLEHILLGLGYAIV